MKLAVSLAAANDAGYDTLAAIFGDSDELRPRHN
jgi:hypothetical protein